MGEHGLKPYAAAICGQERGPRNSSWRGSEIPSGARADDRRRAGRLPGRPGQRHALLPREPRRRRAELEAVLEEAIDRFLSGTFAGDYEADLLAEFHKYLPERPPWPVMESGELGPNELSSAIGVACRHDRVPSGWRRVGMVAGTTCRPAVRRVTACHPAGGQP